jgi:outer membrane protein OmpA-like peptidoglycan-associated protein
MLYNEIYFFKFKEYTVIKFFSLCLILIPLFVFNGFSQNNRKNVNNDRTAIAYFERDESGNHVGTIYLKLKDGRSVGFLWTSNGSRMRNIYNDPDAHKVGAEWQIVYEDCGNSDECPVLISAIFTGRNLSEINQTSGTEKTGTQTLEWASSFEQPSKMGFHTIDLRTGKVRFIGNWRDSSISPNLQYIAGGEFRGQTYSVYIAELVSGNVRRVGGYLVTDPRRAELYSATLKWSADVTRIWTSDEYGETHSFSTGLPARDMANKPGNSRVLKLPKAAYQLFKSQFNKVSGVSISPDQKWIAAYRSKGDYQQINYTGGIFIFSVDSLKVTQITKNISIKKKDGTDDLISWLPNSEGLVFRRTSYEDEWNGGENTNLDTIQLEAESPPITTSGYIDVLEASGSGCRIRILTGDKSYTGIIGFDRLSVLTRRKIRSYEDALAFFDGKQIRVTLSGLTASNNGISNGSFQGIRQMAVLVNKIPKQTKPRWDERVTDTETIIDLSTDILFDFNKSTINPAAIPSLIKLARLLRQTKNGAVQLNGFTDSVGTDEYNVGLSQRRAAAVKQWLINNGSLSADRLITNGFGKEQPVAPNTNSDGTDNPVGRQKNRRVEIRIPRN